MSEYIESEGIMTSTGHILIPFSTLSRLNQAGLDSPQFVERFYEKIVPRVGSSLETVDGIILNARPGQEKWVKRFLEILKLNPKAVSKELHNEYTVKFPTIHLEPQVGGKLNEAA